MVEFLSKSHSRVIKIAQVNSIRMTKSIKFIFCAVPRDDVIESTRFLMRPPVNHSTVYRIEFTAVKFKQIRFRKNCNRNNYLFHFNPFEVIHTSLKII